MFLQGYGWLIGLAVIGVAIWVAALVLVIRSPKFRRKWLWALLTLVTFSYGRHVVPGVTISAGLPFGALYVLWFWRCGPAPIGARRPTR
jgi:ABC-type Co2+ transport system permease subunit